MKTKYSFIISFLFFSLSINAQVFQWQNTFNGTTNSEDVARSTVADNSGNVYVAGYSNNGSSQDFTVHKYSISGSLLWTKIYNGTGNGNDQAAMVTFDNSGNAYASGYCWMTGTGYDIVTMKISPDGTTLWTQIYNGTANSTDISYSIKTDAFSNVFIVGYTTSSSTNVDYIIIKYNTDGVPQWTQKYNYSAANSIDIARAIAFDQSGNIYVIGNSRSGSASGTEDYATLKLNSSGVIQWVQRYNPHNSFDMPTGIAVDLSGNVVISGYSQINGFNNFIIFKYNPSGTVLWYNSYAGTATGNHTTSGLALDQGNSIYVCGTTLDTGMNGTNMTLLKYSSSGGLQWSRKYNGTGNGRDTCLALALDGGYNAYITGGSLGLGTNMDVTTIKYNFNGTQQFVIRSNGFGNGNDEGRSIFVDNGYNIYVAGLMNGGPTGNDMFVYKYAQITTGVNNNEGEIPAEFKLYQNYPNPFNPTTNVQFAIPNVQYVTLKVYNILGNEISTLVNEQLKPGVYKVEIDGTNLPSGVYYYKLITDGFTDTKKMILVK